MRKILALFLGMFCLATVLAALEVPFPASADKPGNWKLTQYARWQRENGTTMLEVNIPKDSPIRNETYGAMIPVDFTPFIGQTVVITFETKAINVPQRENTHLSPKVMLRWNKKNGGQRFLNSAAPYGTYEWVPQQLSLVIGEADTQALLHIGIQNNTGHAWFRNLRIEAKDIDTVFAAPVPVAKGFRCEYTDAVRNMQRLRGSALGTNNTPEDVASLAGNGANLIRLWINYDGFNREMLNKSLERMEILLAEAAKHGMKVIPVLTEVPGARYKKPILLGTTDDNDPTKNQLNFRIFFDKKQLDTYVEIWEQIAKRFKGNPAVFAYDLMNEPTQFGIAKYNYLDCQYRAAKAIQAVDPERPVIISTNNWDTPETFSYLKPLPLKNVIYEVHMYRPNNYTHQGVGKAAKQEVLAGKFLTYPGNIAGENWSREQLANALKVTRDWQQKYGAIIYCGEFSVIRWAPGAAKWLEDVCSLLEEYGWHWAYHAYREFHGWNLECGSVVANNQPVPEITDRMAVMKKYWGRNKK